MKEFGFSFCIFLSQRQLTKMDGRLHDSEITALDNDNVIITSRWYDYTTSRSFILNTVRIFSLFLITKHQRKMAVQRHLQAPATCKLQLPTVAFGPQLKCKFTAVLCKVYRDIGQFRTTKILPK